MVHKLVERESRNHNKYWIIIFTSEKVKQIKKYKLKYNTKIKNKNYTIQK